MSSNSRYPRRTQQPEALHKINSHIKAKTVRVIADDQPPAVYPIEEALRLAKEQLLDLVEIAPEADPPVCKIIDYQKFLYTQKKKQKELKANQSKASMKQIRLGAEIGDHDFGFKMEHAKKFLEEGNKVMALIFFRGRAIVHKSRGEAVLKECIEFLKEVAQVESEIRLEGKKMFVILAPIKKKK